MPLLTWMCRNFCIRAVERREPVRCPRYRTRWLHSVICVLPDGAHTHLTAFCLGLPGWASTRKVKSIWILLKWETMSGSGISWAICKSAPCTRQITMPAPHHSDFTGRMPFLPPNQQRQSTEALCIAWLYQCVWAVCSMHAASAHNVANYLWTCEPKLTVLTSRYQLQFGIALYSFLLLTLLCWRCW